MKLSIIVPFFNEENHILETLQKLNELKFPSYISTIEFIVIDDGSSDNSHEIVSNFSKNKNNFIFLQHEINRGKGAAVKTGIAKANGDIFLMQDADMELSIDDIIVLLDAMHRFNVQFVNGSRYLPGVLRPVSSYRRYLGNKIFTFITSIFINVKLTDMACGYKLIHRDLYNKIKLKEERFGIEAEMILKALRVRKNNIIEVPVHYFPRNYGEGKKLRNKDAFKILWTIIKYGILKFK